MMRHFVNENCIRLLNNETQWFTDRWAEAWWHSYSSLLNFDDEPFSGLHEDDSTPELTITLSDVWHQPKNVRDAWLDFLLSIWSRDYQVRLDSIYHICIQSIAPQMNPTWIQAVERNQWRKLFESLMDLDQHGRHSLYRAMFPDIIVRAACALNCLRACQVLYYPPVRDNHENGVLWCFDTAKDFWLYTIANWPKFFQLWYRPKTYLDCQYLISKHGLGLEILLLAAFCVWVIEDENKYLNQMEFIYAIIPVREWRYTDRISKVPTPNGLHWDEIEEAQWKDADDQSHNVCSYSSEVYLLFKLWLIYCSEIVLRVWGRGTHKRNGGWGSKCVTQPSAQTGVGQVFTNFKMDSIELSDAEVQKLRSVWDKLSHASAANMNKNARVSMYSQSYAISRMFLICNHQVTHTFYFFGV